MRKITAAIVLCAVLLSALLGGCGKSGEEVLVQSVGMLAGWGPVGLAERFGGMVVSNKTVEIQKDEEKVVQELKVSADDTVARGQVLFTYDVDSIKLELEKQKLELEQLQNTISTANSQIQDLEREKRSAGSSQQLEYTLQIQTLQAEIKETEYNVKLKQSEIEKTQTTMKNANVVSPVSGVVQSINETGTDSNGNAAPFIVLAETGAYRVKGTISETNVNSLSEGTEVTIRSRVDDQTWTGTVDSIDWENPVSDNSAMMYGGVSDETTTASKYPFYVRLDDPEGLMLGQHVYIEPGEHEDQEGLWLPEYYICDAEDDPWVWAANEKERLEKRTVELGEYDEADGTYEILSGLSAEDYIALPDETCESGARVTYYSEETDEDSSMGEDVDGELPEEDGSLGEEPFTDDFDEPNGNRGGDDDTMPEENENDGDTTPEDDNGNAGNNQNNGWSFVGGGSTETEAMR